MSLTQSIPGTMAFRVEVRCPDLGQISERIVYCQTNGTFLLWSGADVAHPGITDLEAAIGTAEHYEEREVASGGIRRCDGDDDPNHSDDDREGNVRRPLRRAVRVPRVYDAD